MVAGRHITRGALEVGRRGGAGGRAAPTLTKAMTAAVARQAWLANSRASGTAQKLAGRRNNDRLVGLVARVSSIEGFIKGKRRSTGKRRYCYAPKGETFRLRLRRSILRSLAGSSLLDASSASSSSFWRSLMVSCGP